MVDPVDSHCFSVAPQILPVVDIAIVKHVFDDPLLITETKLSTLFIVSQQNSGGVPQPFYRLQIDRANRRSQAYRVSAERHVFLVSQLHHGPE